MEGLFARMRAIRLLPPEVVSKIAAGEVIERPASVVRETLDNAVDAGARNITVELEEGGRDLIRVVDDGCGIPREQLGLAVRQHATSKIETAEELFRLSTLGFRGEALSSIAGVSELILRSRPAEQPAGAEVEVHHGRIGEVRECGVPFGTQVEVRNLFASVPVRRKFLKSRQTELGHVHESIVRMGLAWPRIGLRLVHHGRTIEERGPDLDLRESIARFFGDDIAGALLPVAAASGDVRISGFVVDPRIDRPNSQMQYLFVNRRFIRDRSLSHALSESYRGLLMTGRYPIAFLFLDLPSEQVDVNVHPTKAEVRFADPHKIYSLVLSAVRGRFLSSDLVARLRIEPPAVRPPAAEPQGVDAGRDEPDALAPSLAFSEPLPQASKRAPAGVLRGAGPPPAPPVRMERAALHRELAVPPRRTTAEPWPSRPMPSEDAPPEKGNGAVPPAPPTPQDARRKGAPLTGKVLQLHDAYLVAETADGMLLVDQHALHERVLYEELRRRASAGSLEVQELLVPEPVELKPAEAAVLLEQRDLLAGLGLKVAEFGPRCVLLESHPAMLRRLDPRSLLREIAEKLLDTGRAPSRDQLLEDLLHMMACKGAVKAGDPLTEEEIRHLLERRELVDDSHHCPHGRPTILRFTLRDLERQFRRV